MKKIILNCFFVLICFAAQADSYGEFRARVKNDPFDPTGTNLQIGSTINVLIDVDQNYYPNNFGSQSDEFNNPTSKQQFIDFNLDFILVDQNGVFPDLLLENKWFSVVGINLQADELNEYTIRYWNYIFKYSVVINSCHFLQSTSYKLAVRVNNVSQYNKDDNSSALYGHFTLEALNFTTGAYQQCKRTQADFQTSTTGKGSLDLNCTLDDILEFNFTDPNAIPALNLAATVDLQCTTFDYKVNMQASGGTAPYSYRLGFYLNPNPTPCSQDLVLPSNPLPYFIWAVDAIGCKVRTQIDLDNFSVLFPDALFDYPDGKYITNASQTVSDQNGDGIIRIKGPLIIEEGINFTLQNKDLQFARDFGDPTWGNTGLPKSGIVVKSFAKLTINDCKLSGIDLCEAMWDGIQVRGDEFPALAINEPATVWFQGELILNNSEINDAIVGVALYNRNFQRTLPLQIYNDPSLHIGNGKITATTTTFRNNRIAISFKADYENFSDSKITNCAFECTALLKDQLNYPNEGTDKFISIIGLDDVSKKIEIKANTFTGNLSLAEDQRATGIYSIGSSYLVSSGKIGTALIPNTFLNLTKGIDAYSNGSLTHVVRIKDNRFNNVMQGITSNGGNFDEISFNVFDIPAGTASINSWGLNLYNSSGYFATENTFNTLANSNYTYGVLARNNSLANGGVYRNTFTGDFYAATQAEQTNSKLTLKCNTYTGNNGYDWAVTSGSLADQGACSGADTKTPAGNLFSLCSVIDESQIFKAVSVPTFIYNSHSGIEPICVSANINVQTCGGPIYDLNTSCATQVDPPGIGKGPGGKTGKNEFKLDRVREIRRLQEEGNIAGIVQLLTNGNLPEEVYLLIPTLIERGDCATARLKLASVALNTSEGQAYFKLYNVLTTLCEGNRNMEQMTASEQQQVQEVSEGSTRVSVHAQAVLAQLNEKAYLRVAERFSLNKSLLPDQQQSETVQEESTFSVFPNPSSGELTVLMNESKNGKIVIFDALGRKYFEQAVDDSYQQKWITKLPNGVFLIQYTHENGITESKCIFVQN